ncbi:tRNA (adenine(22)-N(1))-methyltransferase TrmK [Shewanella sp. AS1]|uniref:tRNA (adenine(22)-N(1))-methyltransferase n=1 Tax=Shewanella sp. AS1 TaxID=2907626 RepID=UPI001F413D2B|nr:tRNA (adenine(22)-N(1))-methyltransferase TrmK [Shewanella sp. AS1]MCE9679439.1 tRNA (adenine(22)-N(1))-methyltransferase TrmK [Shewanella sp. AS1]
MKLSKRLQQLADLAINEVSPDGQTKYDHIWDCCCDHGFLGADLLLKQTGATIHFVDIVPSLITSVHDKLLRFYPPAQYQWQTHCQDVSTLPLDTYSGRQLIILAGVGEDLMIHFVTQLQQGFGNKALDFLLCPVKTPLQLRQQLITLKLSLKQEVLVEENGRFYEVLFVSNDAPGEPITPYGNTLWQADDSQTQASQRYLKRLLNHYQLMVHSDKVQAQASLEAYRAIADQISLTEE